MRLAPVDLGRLTGEVTGKASALGPRRWITDARAAGVLMADAQLLTQALLQLAGNAVRHTGDGDEIAIAHGGRVVLDSPPGLGATFTLVLPVSWPPGHPGGAGRAGGADTPVRSAPVSWHLDEVAGEPAP